MAVIPKAEVKNIVTLLNNLPGISSSSDRRRLLPLVFPSKENAEILPDSAIEAGWGCVIDSLAKPPVSQAITRLIDLLQGIKKAYRLAEGELGKHFDETVSRLQKFPNDRSFSAFLARLVEEDDSETSSIAQLDYAFIPPIQYEQASMLMEQHHILFLFGDPYMGKTFCALHLLWNYFRNDSREPYWWRSLITISLDEPNIKSVIDGGSCIYIEDPFGRFAPIDDTDSILRTLKNLILEAKTKDVRIVVTSRTNVLRAAIADRLQKYTVTLSQELILEKSYDDKALACITAKYIESYQPKWAKNIDIPQFIQRVVSELRAPHNIQEFLWITRSNIDLDTVLGRITEFQDIVEAYSKVFETFEEWILIALVVVAAASDCRVSHDFLSSLYNPLIPHRAPYKSFDAAIRELRDYVTVLSNSQPIPRHPSIEDAVAVLSRRKEFLLEVNWLIVKECYQGASARYQKKLIKTIPSFLGLRFTNDNSFLDRVAIQLLITYADRWSQIPERLSLLKIYFNNDNLTIRAASRRTVLNRLDALNSKTVEIITNIAMNSWGDRFLLQILLSPGSLNNAQYKQLAIVLCESKDDQTRCILAERLGNGLREEVFEEIGPRLLFDTEWLVRYTALCKIVEHFSITSHLEQQIKKSVGELPTRYRKRFAISAGKFKAYKQIFHDCD